MNSPLRTLSWRKDLMTETRKLAAILAADVVGYSGIRRADRGELRHAWRR